MFNNTELEKQLLEQEAPQEEKFIEVEDEDLPFN